MKKGYHKVTKNTFQEAREFLDKGFSHKEVARVCHISEGSVSSLSPYTTYEEWRAETSQAKISRISTSQESTYILFQEHLLEIEQRLDYLTKLCMKYFGILIPKELPTIPPSESPHDNDH